MTSEQEVPLGTYPNLTPAQYDATDRLFMGGILATLALAVAIVAANVGSTKQNVDHVLNGTQTTEVKH